MKRMIKLKLGVIAVALMLAIPLPAMAADVTEFKNFNFKTSPYQDTTQFIIRYNKTYAGSTWYYSIGALSGVGTKESGKIFFLNAGRVGYGFNTMPASIYAGMPINTQLSSYYYSDAPASHLYDLYAQSNDAYGGSMDATVSGLWMP